MIRLGTSGFSYDDWIGPVYPEDLPRWQWLSFYAEEYDTVELNVTYYRVPSRKTAAGWVDRTPDGFVFSVKANRELTHVRQQPDFGPFVDSLGPLIAAEKLACVLAQFPFSFHPNPANREYLVTVREGFGDLPVAVEFRDRAWVTDDTFEMLESLGFGYCAVDEPPLRGLMPPIAPSTGSLAYVRFHGRNSAKWWKHDHAWERYDYSYSDDELREWVPKIRGLEADSKPVLVYANNHFRGQSIETIKKLRRLLGEDRLV